MAARSVCHWLLLSELLGFELPNPSSFKRPMDMRSWRRRVNFWCRSLAGLGCVALLAASCSNLTSRHTSIGDAPTTAQPSFTGSSALPQSVGQADSISCSSNVNCVVVGHGVAYTINGGRSWSVGSLPSTIAESATANLDSLSCPSTTNCVTGGDGPSGSFVLTSADGGRSWAEGSLPEGPGLNGLFCNSVDNCVGMGSGEAIVSTNGGHSWTGVGTGPSQSLNAVSCPSPVKCVAVADYDTTTGMSSAAVSSDNGQSWTAATAPPGVHDFQSISCGSVNNCVAVGADAVNECGSGTNGCSMLGTQTGAIEFSTNGGGSWVLVPAPSSALQLRGVACGSATRCVAVGNGAAGTGEVAVFSADGGATWSSGALSGTGDASSFLDSVSCPSPEECVAVGGGTSSSGPTLTFTTDGGSNWHFVAPFSNS